MYGVIYSDNENKFHETSLWSCRYYQGDTESFETLNSWLDGDVPKSNTKPDVTYEEPPNIHRSSSGPIVLDTVME